MVGYIIIGLKWGPRGGGQVTVDILDNGRIFTDQALIDTRIERSLSMSEIFNTTCYTLTHALIWFALGIMGGYGLFKPEKKRRRKDV